MWTQFMDMHSGGGPMSLFWTNTFLTLLAIFCVVVIVFFAALIRDLFR